jgi:glycosyltransferase involved in cell wall biosynthesis
MNPTENQIPTNAGEPGNPVVSVVIPAYNAAEYIASTLNSVLAQTLRSFEILVINDGSPDTAALEQALQPFLSQICYVQQENRGPSAARNAAIRLARGKYIAFLDSDDSWFPNHLEKQVAALENDPSLGLIYSNVLHVEDGVPIAVAFDRTPQSEPVSFEALLREDCTVGTSATVAVRQVILDAGLFDEGLRRCEDFDLWLRMANNGAHMTFTPDIQIYHRLANGLAGNHELMKRARMQVYEKASLLRNVTGDQQRVIRRKISEIKIEIQVELAKQALLSGRFDAARCAAREAASGSPSWKLRATQVGLRLFPGLLQSFYRRYLQRLERRKREQRVRALQDRNVVTNLDVAALTGTMPGPRDADPTGLSAKSH